jgi:hypothetical protein
MGRKKDEVVNTVFKQSKPFYSIDIIKQSDSSVALVSNTLNELIEQGKLSSRKQGRKIVYTLVNGYNNTEMSITTEPICTMSEKFEYIRNIVRMVINGVNPSALITGRSGVGKTYLVESELQAVGLEKDNDYLFVSGHSSAFGLYKLLHDNRENFIIFDDCDSVFRDAKSVNILKSALDSYDVRRVSWISEKTDSKDDIDPYFDFEGRIIFISNLYAERIDEAVRSRSFCVNLRMTDEEVTEHIRNILPALEPNIPMSIKQEVLDYISEISTCFEAYGLRTFMQACRIREGSAVYSDWKKMIKVITCNL